MTDYHDDVTKLRSYAMLRRTAGNSSLNPPQFPSVQLICRLRGNLAALSLWLIASLRKMSLLHRMPTVSKHLTDILIRACNFLISSLILLRYRLEKATPPKIFTWRLLMRTRDNRKPPGLTVETLKRALETHFEVSLTTSELSLQSQLEEYCAVLTLRDPKTLFEVGQDFELQLDLTENEQISLKWVPIQTNCISHSNPDLSSVTPDKNFEGITTLYDKTDDGNAVE